MFCINGSISRICTAPDSCQASPSSIVHPIVCLEILDHFRRSGVYSSRPRTPFDYPMHEEKRVKYPYSVSTLSTLQKGGGNLPDRNPKCNSTYLKQPHGIQIRKAFSTPKIRGYIAHHHHHRRIRIHGRCGSLPYIENPAPNRKDEGRDEGGPDDKVHDQLQNVGDAFGCSYGVDACEGVVQECYR